MPTIIEELVTVLTFRGEAEGIQRTRQQIRGMADDFSTAARGIGIIGAGLTALGGISLGMGISWETAWTDVLKTVNGTDQELANLETRLRRMAKDDVPLPVEGLADIAASAGQLGIHTPNIEKFTKVIAGLSATTNLAAEQGSQDLARFANITQMSQDDFDRLGATIVHLGNNFATTEAEIVEMSLRLAANGKLIGLTESQILALATGLTSVGINAEAGGTALSRVFADMDKAVQTGGAELHIFNELLGKDFATLFEAAPDQAVVEFIAALKGMIDSGGNVHTILEELGFDNVRVRDALLRSAGAGDLMSDALAQGTQAWKDNIALTREAALRYQTSASQIQFAKNQARDLGITVGGILAPSLISVLAALKPIIASVGELAEEHPGLIKVVAVLAGGLVVLAGVLFAGATAMRIFAFGMGPANMLTTWWTRNLITLRIQLFLMAAQAKLTAAAQWLWNAATAAGRAITSGTAIGMIALRIAMVAGAIATGIATAAQWALNIAMYANPIGLIILGIVALIAIVVAVGLVIWKFRDTIVNAFNQALEWVKDNWPLLLAILTGPFGLAVYAIWKFRDEILAVFKSIADAIPDWLKNGFNAVIGGAKITASAAGDALGFAEGGIVPGPTGRPMPAIVHGGEAIFTADMVRRMALGPEALAPSLPPPVPAFAGGGRSVTVGDVTITVHVGEGANADEIADTIERRWKDQIEDLVGDFDGPIVR